MTDIETILVEKYNLKPTCRDLNGSRCIGAQNNYMTGFVAMPGHFDVSEKWIVRFIPVVPRFVRYGLRYFQLGAMIEERFDTKDECVEWLNTKVDTVFKKLYIYTLDVIGGLTSIRRLEKLDPTNRGEFMEVLK